MSPLVLRSQGERTGIELVSQIYVEHQERVLAAKLAEKDRANREAEVLIVERTIKVEGTLVPLLRKRA